MPPARWLDGVKKDLKAIGVTQWKAIARDRVRWERLCEIALACSRL